MPIDLKPKVTYSISGKGRNSFPYKVFTTSLTSTQVPSHRKLNSVSEGLEHSERKVDDCRLYSG